MQRVATRGYYLSFGSFGLKAMEAGWIRANQLESARRAIAHFVQRGGKIWIRVFPNKPRTQKGAEVGMGGGAGSLSHFVASVESGRIIFEMDGVPEKSAREAFRLAAHKLPLKAKFIKK
jgi:large subunit ribosomal protein L16